MKIPSEAKAKAKVDISWIIIGVLIVLFFFFCTGFGLHNDLGNDDIMNLTFAWMPPLSDLLAALFNPFSSFYRPTGALVYRTIFALTGLRAFPFRIFTYLLLTLNLGLVYRLAKSLSKSKEVAALSSLLFAFHGRLALIYSNNGAIYDILCATISLLLLLCYMTWRLEKKALTPANHLTLLLLFMLALNAKEMAAIVPLTLLVFEWIYCDSSDTGAIASIKAFVMRCLPALLASVLALIAFKSKTGNGSALHNNPAYQLTFSSSQFFHLWRALMGDLFYAGERGLTTTEVILIWVGIIGLAAVFRRKELWWLAWFSLLSPLPILFIPYRHFFVMYFPLVGWAIFAATVVVEGRNWLWRKVWNRPALGESAFEPERIALLLGAAILIQSLPKSDSLSNLKLDDPSQAQIRQTINDLDHRSVEIQPMLV
jgi:Dolichyl-phosphate-mannose-protein mannosyltransferase